VRRSQPFGLTDVSRRGDSAAPPVPAAPAAPLASARPVTVAASAASAAVAAPAPWAAGVGVAPAGLPAVGDFVLGGKYRIDERLGSGGMGVVMAAEHITLGQKVAFKFLVPRASPGDVTARFLREARSAARLDSEHVVRVSDVGVLESGAAYMLMERLEGEDLGAYLRRVGPLPFAEAVLHVLQACDAVAAAHAAGIIHRDLKPANLFLARWPDGHQAVKVLDFGISKTSGLARDAVDQSLTRPGAVLGSPLYMSPEQVRDTKAVDARTDLWSLGMVLYELLVGSPMYNIDTLPALCAAIVADPPVPLRAKRADAPPELEAAILRCTQKAPDQRFPSVAEFAHAIAPFGPPEGALLAARIARRLGTKGDLLSGHIAASGTFTGARTILAPAPAPAPAVPVAKPAPARRWQGTALALGFPLAILLITAIFTYARRSPPDKQSPAPSPLPPSAQADTKTTLPFVATAAPTGPAAPPLASATSPPPLASVASATSTRVPSTEPVGASPTAAAAPSGSASASPRKPPPGRLGKPVSEFDNGALLNRR
jgi:eukaryotic-like serine/threonine-protein kinase